MDFLFFLFFFLLSQYIALTSVNTELGGSPAGGGGEGGEEEKIALVTVFSLTVGAIATETGIVSHAKPMMNSE